MRRKAFKETWACNKEQLTTRQEEASECPQLMKQLFFRKQKKKKKKKKKRTTTNKRKKKRREKFHGYEARDERTTRSASLTPIKPESDEKPRDKSSEEQQHEQEAIQHLCSIDTSPHTKQRQIRKKTGEKKIQIVDLTRVLRTDDFSSKICKCSIFSLFH